LVRACSGRSESAPADVSEAEGVTIHRLVGRGRVRRSSARLDPVEERALAEEGLRAEGVEWPPYRGAR
ncbi:MAG: hypothetical protein ABI311_01130, partial [Gemmatimonadaceae bacterium]